MNRIFAIGSMLALLAALVSSCAMNSAGGDSVYEQYHNYTVPARKANNPANVRVYVSIDEQMTYVMEGDRPLLVMPVTTGKAGHRTPLGTFHVGEMTENRRANSHGFFLYGNQWREGWTREHYGRRHIGTPMPYWTGFREKPNYAFHTELLQPVASSHGCIRMHMNAAPYFFELVRPGTTINVAQSQPWDDTLGAEVERPVTPDWRDYSIEDRMDDAFFDMHKPLNWQD